MSLSFGSELSRPKLVRELDLASEQVEMNLQELAPQPYFDSVHPFALLYRSLQVMTRVN
jgi:hypothetical protein